MSQFGLGHQVGQGHIGIGSGHEVGPMILQQVLLHALEDRGILRWNNANGTQTDVWTAAIRADTVYEAVTGPCRQEADIGSEG